MNLSIGTLCNSIDTLGDNNYTTITNTSTSTRLSMRVHGGFKGNKASNGSGGRGGNGGGLCVGKSEIITFTTLDKKTPQNAEYRFGSGYGGGGQSRNGFGFYGNSVKAFEMRDNIYEYKNIANDDSREYDNRGLHGANCFLDFGKTLNQKQCDNTGTVNMLSGGTGGRTATVGSNGPPGFIMIFHKTTTPLTESSGGNTRKK